MPFLTQMKCVSLSSDEMNCTAMLFDFILFDGANSGCIKKKVSGISNHLLEYMTRSQKVVPGQGGLLFHEIKCPPVSF